MPLAEMLLASMMAFGAATRTADEERFEIISDAIAEASESRPLWPGAQGRAATATLLLAIAIHESGLREEVQTCRRGGDGGRSKGLFQLMHPVSTAPCSVTELCASPHIQATAALRVLWRHRDQCSGRCAPRRWINGYASGDGRRDTTAAREIASLWTVLAARAGVTVVPQAVSAPTAAPRPKPARARRSDGAGSLDRS
jgi:hypothetical protein